MTTPANEPLLDLHDPELEWKRFERFCLDLVKALPDVRDAHLYGDRGDDQEGIDIHVDLVDGRVRTVQCRRVKRFGKPAAEKTINDTTYPGDEHQIWATGPLTAPARNVIKAATKWEAWDIEQISSAVRALPREVGRWIVEDHLGQQERRRVLGPESELVVAPAQAWFARSDSNPRALQTSQPLVGRQDELRLLEGAVLDPDVACVILVGRGGIGKTRLLRAVADQLADRRVLIVREGVDVGASLGAELPMAPFDLIVDDAHQRRDLSNVLATVFARDEFETVILSTRPHRVPGIRDQLHAVGLPGDAVLVLDPLQPLAEDAAERLAQGELEEDQQPLAQQLGAMTRDAPAILVLAAKLVSSGEVDAATLVASPTLRQEVLTRYREERLGEVDDAVPPATTSRLLSLIAAVQPIDPAAPLMPKWLGDQIGESAGVVATALDALTEADLLVGTRHRRSVGPDVLADHLLHEQCVDRDDQPTARARELVEAVPLEMLGQVMGNLAELDWRLGRAGAPRILDQVCEELGRRLVSFDAWTRERHLEQLVDSAAYLAPWVVRLARQLLDHPAAETTLLGTHVVTDADSRRELVRLLAQAGLDPDQTATAIRLLWEIGADLDPQASRGGGDPLEEARRLGDYQRPLTYAEKLLTVSEQLLADPATAEGHRRLPLELLSGLVRREGTTTEMASRTAIRLGAYIVSAEGAASLRTRLRDLLVKLTLEGGERTRVAAAALLGDMLRQPHGYYGKPVPRDQLRQWRPEQLAILRDLDRILAGNNDPLVAREIRHGVEWHGEYSGLYGIKTVVRRLVKAHPAKLDEQLADFLTQSLARFSEYKVLERRRRAFARELRAEEPSVEKLLDRVDDMALRLARCRPQLHLNVGPLLAALATDDTWALEAYDILIAEPNRPTGAGVGVLLTQVLAHRPEEVRERVASLATSQDAILRRQAADHISRLAWFGDPDAPERPIAVALAGDDDPTVVLHMLTAALRCAAEDMSLAVEIVMAVRDLSLPELADVACMAVATPLPLTDAQWQQLLDKLLSCPNVEYHYEQVLRQRGSTSWRQVFDHLLARIEGRRDDPSYDALPVDGLGNVLQAAATQRRSALSEIIARLARGSGHDTWHLPRLFWSFAGEGDEALETIGEALASDDQRTAAAIVLSNGPRRRFLASPGWVTSQLEASEAGGPLDDLRGALSGALHSGSRMGTPGEPYPEDVELETKARSHAAASAAGSRSQAFWTQVANAALADMARELRADEEAGDV